MVWPAAAPLAKRHNRRAKYTKVLTKSESHSVNMANHLLATRKAVRERRRLVQPRIADSNQSPTRQPERSGKGL